jgi:hypothetical protein
MRPTLRRGVGVAKHITSGERVFLSDTYSQSKCASPFASSFKRSTKVVSANLMR